MSSGIVMRVSPEMSCSVAGTGRRESISALPLEVTLPIDASVVCFGVQCGSRPDHCKQAVSPCPVDMNPLLILFSRSLHSLKEQGEREESGGDGRHKSCRSLH